MHISIIEPVGGHGGMDYYDYGLAYGLGANGVDVLFYTSDKTQVRAFTNVQTKLFFKGVWGSSFLTKTRLYIQGHIAAYRDSKKNGVKIVHLHFFFFRGIDLLMLLLAKSFGLKVVVTVHDVNSFHNNSKQSVEKLCYKLIDGVIVHNRSSFNTIEEKGMRTGKIAIIPHGNYLPFITAAEKAPKSSSPFTLLFFGQIKDVKGLDILLNAFKKVTAVKQDVQLIIAGKAYKNDLGVYENLIEELGIAPFIKTDFRYIPDDEVASFFSQADLVILPYREIYQSGVLLLTMSYGKPLLCSDLAAFEEIIIDKENGFTFKSENDDDLADKLLAIMDDPELLAKVSANASKVIRNDFDWVKIGAKTAAFYKLMD